MTPFAIPPSITAIQSQLSAPIQNRIDAVSQYIQSGFLEVGIVHADQVLRQEWKQTGVTAPGVRFFELDISQEIGSDGLFRIACTDCLFVFCSAIQLITNDLNQAIGQFSGWKKTLVVFIGGFEYIGQSPEIIEGKIKEASSVYPYPLHIIYAAGEPAFSGSTSRIDTLATQVDKALASLAPRREQLRESQFPHLIKSLEHTIEQYLQPHRQKIQDKQQKLEQEMQGAEQISKIQESRDTAISSYIRTYFDLWAVKLNELDAKEAYHQYDKSARQQYFDVHKFYHNLSDSLIDYVKTKLRAVEKEPEEFEQAQNKFCEQVASFWKDNLAAWKRLLPVNEQLYELWAQKEEVKVHFSPLFLNISSFMDDLTPALEIKAEVKLSAIIEELSPNLKKALIRSYDNSISPGPLNTPDVSANTDYLMDDALQSLNITAGSSLPVLIKSILQRLRQFLVSEVDQLKLLYIKKTAYLQQRAIAEFTTQIRSQLREDYSSYKAQTQDILSFNISQDDK